MLKTVVLVFNTGHPIKELMLTIIGSRNPRTSESSPREDIPISTDEMAVVAMDI